MHVSYLQIHELLGSKKQKETNDTVRSRDETVMTEVGMAPDLIARFCTVLNEVQTVLNEVQTRSNEVCAFRILFRTVRVDLV
jgi:hypothetical protein